MAEGIIRCLRVISGLWLDACFSCVFGREAAKCVGREFPHKRNTAILKACDDFSDGLRIHRASFESSERMECGPANGIVGRAKQGPHGREAEFRRGMDPAKYIGGIVLYL